MIELCCQYLSVRCIWLYAIIMSHTSFRVNSFLEAGDISEVCIWSLYLKFVSSVHIWRICHIGMHGTEKYSKHSSIIWLVWLNGCDFVYELSGCGFESSCLCSLCSFLTENTFLGVNLVQNIENCQFVLKFST